MFHRSDMRSEGKRSPRYPRGYGAPFAAHVGPADEGCDFDFLAPLDDALRAIEQEGIFWTRV